MSQILGWIWSKETSKTDQCWWISGGCYFWRKGTLGRSMRGSLGALSEPGGGLHGCTHVTSHRAVNWPPVPFTVYLNDKKRCLTYLQNPKALRYGQRGLPAFLSSLASRTPAINWYSSDGILASALSKYRKTPTAWHELLSVSSKTDLAFLPPCFAGEPLKSGWIKEVDHPYQSEQQNFVDSEFFITQ